MQIAICDDMLEVCAELENILLDFQAKTNREMHISTFYSGEALIERMKAGESFDLIFLDIELHHVNGVEVGRFIRYELDGHITKIIYMSVKDSYDRQLFEVQPLQFLEKPFGQLDVTKGIELAYKISDRDQTMFAYQIGTQTYRVPLKNILYFESHLRKIRLVGVKEAVEFYGKVHDVLKQLRGMSFVRPHKAYIVNYAYVSKVRYEELEMANEDHIPVSQGKRKAMREFHLEYIGRQT